MSDLIVGSLCLTKIPKDDHIKVGKDGKKYLNVCIAARREPDQYGNTHAIYVSQTREERDAKAERIYIGSGRLYDPTPADASPEAVAAMPAADNVEDLPW